MLPQKSTGIQGSGILVWIKEPPVKIRQRFLYRQERQRAGYAVFFHQVHAGVIQQVEQGQHAEQAYASGGEAGA